MVGQVPHGARYVIELGAGTGVFTEKLLALEPQLSELFVLELNAEMHAQLQQRFAKASVVCGDATNLAGLVREQARFSVGDADAVISGLGLLNMPAHVVNAILQSSFEVLRPGAPFIQFTYGPMCPITAAQREQFGLSAERVSFTLRNFPPASVWVMRKIAR
jgi:phosphatidylethanolamine/phosphatidyl-N-methylethanolamine N-methyltransferase